MSSIFVCSGVVVSGSSKIADVYPDVLLIGCAGGAAYSWKIGSNGQ